MAKVRLIRVLEYTFKDNKTADAHIANMGVPFTGTKEFGPHSDPIMVIRSAAVIDLSDYGNEVKNDIALT